MEGLSYPAAFSRTWWAAGLQTEDFALDLQRRLGIRHQSARARPEHVDARGQLPGQPELSGKLDSGGRAHDRDTGSDPTLDEVAGQRGPLIGDGHRFGRVVQRSGGRREGLADPPARERHLRVVGGVLAQVAVCSAEVVARPQQSVPGADLVAGLQRGQADPAEPLGECLPLLVPCRLVAFGYRACRDQHLAEVGAAPYTA
ncbi:hypothetical protein AVL59_21250 [Streptomyces griseochromogenes]|uniref:Uncharacterized protein n=1 Tax=Streptomyces griseochromogenes TaxID=68214 RepID=A0A1B1AZ01_9ACTN|nr:hypothetical protein AVL59_21250 [Streptomyces griseochromogenes]